MRFGVWLVSAMWAAGAVAATGDGKVLGQQPSYVEGPPASFPNQQAITPRVWIPGLDEGWTPQGVALSGRYALVTSYQDQDPGKAR